VFNKNKCYRGVIFNVTHKTPDDTRCWKDIRYQGLNESKPLPDNVMREYLRGRGCGLEYGQAVDINSAVSHFVLGLVPYNNYTIDVTSVNSKGLGTSQSKSIETHQD
ncbi:unnamed protein product, partial [Owenia fusiformis]